jgi:hypothetical protein
MFLGTTCGLLFFSLGFEGRAPRGAGIPNGLGVLW